jgi:hypothetical protein
MTTVAIRKKLVDYLKVADDKKVKAMYALLEDDIEQELEYSPGLRNQLDAASAYYKKGGKMIGAATADKEIKKLLQAFKRK